MIDIDQLLQKFCRAGADAMHRYAAVSGEAPDDLPEYFMPAIILDRLGDEVTTTLETGFSKLSAWNNDARLRDNKPPRARDEETELLMLAEELGRPRVDMVIYAGDDEGRPKDKLDFLALVEFKRGWVLTEERAKLLKILPHIDTCPYGMVCGSLRGLANLNWNHEQAEKTGDRWCMSEMRPLPGTETEYFFAARFFERSATP